MAVTAAHTLADTDGCDALALQPSRSEQQQECPKCGGTGFVECFCTRWSDGDGGCGSCRGTGRMVCNACGGGGTAVPIKATLPAQSRNEITGRPEESSDWS